MKSINKIITTRISTVKLRDDGILHIDIMPNEYFEKRDAEELIQAAKEIGGGSKFKNLITVGEFTVADSEAIKLACSESGSAYKLADAFVIQTLSQKFLGNMYLNFYKPIRPTRFFQDVKKAEEWLNSIV